MTDQIDTEVQDFGEAPLPQIPKESNRTTTILLIVAGAAFFCLCIVPVCVIVVLALLGPSIGNVFSEINAGL
jgi:hypothetical protein